MKKYRTIYGHLQTSWKLIGRFWYVAFLVVVPIIFHLFYSKFGINPTDDGFILSYSRRILSGEIPHRDFISIRPIGSALIHLPIVLFAGDYTIYASRYFVWLELASIAVATLMVVEKMLKIKLNIIIRVIVSLLAIFCSAHTFPIMAWHTIDGLFVASIGILLVTLDSQKAKLVGYFFIGFSYLCKQNFLPVSLLVPFLITDDWKNWKNWFLVALPGILYLLPGLATGSIGLYISQIASQSDLRQSGFLVYQNSSYFLQSTIIGLLIFLLLFFPKLRSNNERIVGFGLGTLLLLTEIKKILFLLPSGSYHSESSFQIAGLVFGLLIYSLITIKTNDNLFKLVTTFSVLVWSSSISVGYNNPALASGILVILLVGTIFFALRGLCVDSILNKVIIIGMSCVLAVVNLVSFRSFDIARKELIYRELSSNNLTYKLDGVLLGGKNILTNQNVYNFFSEIKQIKEGLGENTKYAILPEASIYWVKSNQENPLPIDWPLSMEVSNEENKLESAVDNFINNGGVIILEKYICSQIARTLSPQLPQSGYPVRDYITSKYKTYKTSETEFFDIYKK